ncbi:rhomboid family intramembrane serine protease [Tenacibaculum maritimum]|uniref:Rhomboid family protein membrane endopeptidase n=1 Tax=Tenacibaculum maritimum NCIMB 2154 TaxID=1349785 RepID=A0A2H1EB11_9FLAO|nr:rhomboid family intramembrane serine protease [Tenacibaculum maritimum]MCD9562777.1 rhomboid family intramembrane serine protease [Tenacibaculum maritimum]MCD9565881.1 rhomboid family intramembrane serine protease [Tenacibaculum maritimum]MCD9579429.1 rhomboid family intramembrane serine protease [Tenacibaculum maritimum]MCD9584799.1 rhomboid family intramembrane serine protease [Tenacibaculum maritimum]MCD9596188.1 rhomboid family intramembrane serine protease [Tenacibaculum maritimum]
MPKLTEAIKHLIIINAILFIAPQLLNMDLTNIFALHFPKNNHFGIWQYITHMFMHGSFAHILFNMYALWAFGTPLEHMWGRNKFLFFYFSAGIGAGLIYSAVNYYQFHTIYEQLVGFNLSASDIQNILDSGRYNDQIISLPREKMSEFYSLYHTPAVGASGAVYGVLVAFGMAFPNAKLALIFLPIPIAAKYFIPLMILGDLFFGVTKYSIGNVAHFAHIGGAIIGFIIAWYWKKNQFRML